MALSANDPAKFYRDQDDVDNDTPVPCRMLAVVGGITGSLVTIEDPTVPYGPVASPFAWTADATPVPLVGIGVPSAYSVAEVDAISDNANAAASASASASFAELLAKGLILPVGLNSGDPIGGWDYDNDTGIWDRRFSDDDLFFTFSAYGDAITNVFVLVQDSASGATGQMVVEVAFWPRTTGAKTKTASVVVNSAGTGFTQNIDVDVSSIIPATASEMSIKVTTGADVAPAGGPFYQLKQIYWTPQ